MESSAAGSAFRGRPSLLNHLQIRVQPHAAVAFELLSLKLEELLAVLEMQPFELFLLAAEAANE